MKSLNPSRPSTPLKDTFKVLVRVNPIKDSCWDIRPPILKSPKQEFVHEPIYHYESNAEIYSNKVSKIIHSAMEGYNATLFAYGTTASGKTHSIFGSNNEMGIIPLALETVFDIIKNSEKEYLLRITFLEIYNEQIKDLLAESAQPLRILENKARGAFVWPLQEVIVTSKDQCIEFIEQGLVRRHSAATDYNAHSSRSHAIFQIIIESRELNGQSVLLSTLNLIDLAGSEKATSSKQRQLESHYINRSLLSLSKVISLLIEGTNKHIPYRDSKLTRILQSSLCGNAFVLVLCCINPHHDALDESINTMYFADRLRKMLVKAGKTKVLDDQALLQKYRNEIRNLQLQLEKQPQILPKRVSSLSSPDFRTDEEKEEWTNERNKLMEENLKYKKELEEQELLRNALRERIDHLTNLILTSNKVKKDLTVPKVRRPVSIMALSDITRQAERLNGADGEVTGKLIQRESEIRKLTAKIKKLEEKMAPLEDITNALILGNLDEAKILALKLKGQTSAVSSTSVSKKTSINFEGNNFQNYLSWKSVMREIKIESLKRRMLSTKDAEFFHGWIEDKLRVNRPANEKELTYKIAELEAEITMTRSILTFI
eukprot:NODE_10_length_61504_cov_0.956502.p4 type:complete len:601 gc:universal NODE_10_length_61504_cov_0.956502:6042-4240(-)